MNEAMFFKVTGWDFLVIGVYLSLVLSIGFIVKKVSRNASDYFRGGGNMLWWMAGMSAMMAGISTYSFTALSARAYKDGVFFMTFSLISGLLVLPLGLYMAPRFRQMRVITSLEAVFRRFGFGTEQFFTWIILPQGLFWGGIGLNTVSVFMASAFGLNMNLTLILLGSITTILAMLAGQWGVAMSDFVQGIVMFLVVFVVVIFSANLPEIGGFSNLPNVLPERYFSFHVGGARTAMVLLAMISGPIFSALSTFDMQSNGVKFLLVKNGRQARKMILLMFVFGNIVATPLLLQIPAYCAGVVFPDMKAVFPNLKFPEEGVFVAMAFKTLPPGLLGLLICGMFAASMTSMDTALNRNAGYFVRNIYIKYINPGTDEVRQLWVGRLATLGFGAIMIIIGMAFNHLRGLNIFDMFLLLNALILLPLTIPTSLGVIFRKTPPWSGWSTVLVGIVAGAIAKQLYSPRLVEWIFNYNYPLNERETIDSQSFFISIIVLVMAAGWFFLTTIWYDQSPEEFKQRNDNFFRDMVTPIDETAEKIVNQDIMQYKTVSLIAMMFGTAIMLGFFIPNELKNRLVFICIGGVLDFIGLSFRLIAWRREKKQSTITPPEETASTI